MDYALQTLYYTLQAIINFVLSIQIVQGVTLGGILFSVVLLSAVFYGIGLFTRSRNGSLFDIKELSIS